MRLGRGGREGEREGLAVAEHVDDLLTKLKLDQVDSGGASATPPSAPSSPSYPTFADRHRDRDALLAILHELFLQRSSDEWLTLLNVCGVAAGSVNDVATAFQDPQAVARVTLVDVEHPRLGTVRHIAAPLRVDDQPPPIRRAEEQAPSQWLMVDVSGHFTIDG